MIKWSRLIALVALIAIAFFLMGTTTDKIAKDIRLGLDLQGGFEIVYHVEPLQQGAAVANDLLKATAAMIEQRVNIGGVTEPEVTIENPDRIRVKLAGVTDQESLRNLIDKPAVLTFRDSNGHTVMQGTDLAPNGASVGFDDLKRPVIVLKFNAADKFRDVTKANLHRNVAIYLDDTMLTNPVIDEVIPDGSAQIRGQRTVEEANQLAKIINAGALPSKLVQLQANQVGASLGAMSLDKTLTAGYIGFAAVLLFMLAIYRMLGMIANITLLVFAYICMVMLGWMEATLTLPGIAGFILSVGMAVDANIITYERIQEEIRSGKTIRSSFRAGQRHSFVTIIDSHVTTIIAAVVLLAFGSSSIQGFSIILIMTLVTSLLTNVYGSRLLLGQVLATNTCKRPGWFGVKRENIAVQQDERQIVKFDIVKNRRKFYAVSLGILLIGLVTMIGFGLNLGVDFKAGTRLDLMIGKPFQTVDIAAVIQQDVPSVDFKPVTTFGSKQEWATTTFEKPVDKADLERIQHNLQQKYGSQVSRQESTVSPVIAEEMVKKAVVAVLLAALGIAIYIAFRFQLLFGIACVIALLHDVFIPMALFSVFQLEIDLTFIAAMLTIVGYSINDTIVIFDRIRENLKTTKVRTVEDLQQMVNVSLWQTMRRSLFTVATVFVTALSSAVLGSDGIRSFSLALIFGLVSGTYSSIFIAAQVWVTLKKREFARKQKAAIE